MSSDRIVKLNIGGTLFQTKKSTLTKLDGFFKTRFVQDNFEYDENGCIFIDRDTKHFRFILNFLRDHRAPLPTNELDRAELYLESQFYGLKELQKCLGNEEVGCENEEVQEEYDQESPEDFDPGPHKIQLIETYEQLLDFIVYSREIFPK